MLPAFASLDSDSHDKGLFGHGSLLLSKLRAFVGRDDGGKIKLTADYLAVGRF